MRYFPIFIDSKDLNILVIGGGDSAYIKIKRLLEGDFKIYVIAEVIKDAIYHLKSTYDTQLFLKEKTIDGNFRFFGYDAVVLATSNIPLNEALLTRAKQSSIPVLSTSNAESSDFHLSSIIKRGPLVVSIRSENPTITKYLRKDIGNFLNQYNINKIEQMNAIRRRLIEKNSPDISKIMEMLWREEKITKNTLEASIEDSNRH